MLLDSRDELARLHAALQAFLVSPPAELALAAEQSGNPAPYESFLPGLRVRKTVGSIVLRHLPDGWLDLEGSTENLLKYTSHFYFAANTEFDHHHPENSNVLGYMSPSSLRLIIEADSSWSESGDV